MNGIPIVLETERTCTAQRLLYEKSSAYDNSDWKTRRSKEYSDRRLRCEIVGFPGSQDEHFAVLGAQRYYNYSACEKLNSAVGISPPFETLADLVSKWKCMFWTRLPVIP